MSPIELRRLAARLDHQGHHDLARQARARASDREAGQSVPVDDQFASLMLLPPSAHRVLPDQHYGGGR